MHNIWASNDFRIPIVTLVTGQHDPPTKSEGSSAGFLNLAYEDCRKIFGARNDLVTSVVTLVSGQQDLLAKSLDLRMMI